MKNFKKSIILGAVFLIIVVIMIIKNLENSKYEELQDEEIMIYDNTLEKEESFIILHITGEVNNPGVIKLKEGSRLIDAVEESGGLTNLADTNRINLAYILSDGQKIYIPSIYDEKKEDYITEEIGENVLQNNSKTNDKVNINTATQTELETLSGIGPSTALKIINYRNEHGKFKNIDEVKSVPGIGENKFNIIKDQICI